ncbi:hypothetical protein P7C70_g7108, partial [Phenoliferia sp. Uapishka_3]
MLRLFSTPLTSLPPIAALDRDSIQYRPPAKSGLPCQSTKQDSAPPRTSGQYGNVGVQRVVVCEFAVSDYYRYPFYCSQVPNKNIPSCQPGTRMPSQSDTGALTDSMAVQKPVHSDLNTAAPPGSLPDSDTTSPSICNAALETESPGALQPILSAGHGSGSPPLEN